MDTMLRITVLMENHAAREGLESEHGFSCFVETPESRVLFDCGASEAFARNAESLGVDVSRADAIVLSHGHYDHTGGLAEALRLAPDARVYGHPTVRRRRFSLSDPVNARDIGMPAAAREALMHHGERFTETPMPAEVGPGVWVTGEVARDTVFEDTGGPFALDPGGRVTDVLPDDQSLFIHTRDGVVVLLGCAHSGVVNTLRQIRRITLDAPIVAVLGGMHLVRADDVRLRETIDAFGKLDVARLGPCHCTGKPATEALGRAFPDTIVEVAAGSVFEFPLR